MTSDRPFKKILVCITEDWFALSHFQPLLAALGQLASTVLVATRTSGRESEIEALGARVIPVDYHRGSLHPGHHIAVASMLARIARQEAVDAAHLVAMQPAFVGSFALARRDIPVVVHVTGLGTLFNSPTTRARLVRMGTLAAIRKVLLPGRRHWLIVENPDDLAELRARRIGTDNCCSIVGGAGIPLEQFPVLEAPRNRVPVIGFAGRMIRAKGLEVAVGALDILAQRQVHAILRLYGRHDPESADAIQEQTLSGWAARPDVEWMGFTSDVVGIWQNCDIAIQPSLTREGMPRAMLEAAACGRPIVVTDVPGPRSFVTSQNEALLVPPGDATALADAIERLVGSPELREVTGHAARRRVETHFSDAVFKAEIARIYGHLAAQ